MSGNASAWLTTFKAQLAADKKKAVILGSLFLVLVGVVLKTFVFSGAPDQADAAPAAASPQSPQVQPEPKVRPSPQEAKPEQSGRGAVAVSQTPKTAPPRGRPAGTGPSRAVVVDDIPLVLTRDIFNVDSWSRFNRTTHRFSFGGGDAAGEDNPTPAVSFWASLAAAIGERQKSAQLEAQQVAADLAELQLQSTLTGTIPLAYISGRLMHEGDEIKGFSVVRIEDRRVLLRRHGFNHELTMP